MTLLQKIAICAIPSISYFLSLKVYGRYMKLKRYTVHSTNSTHLLRLQTMSDTVILLSFISNFCIQYLFEYSQPKNNQVRFAFVFMGMLIVDTVEYWSHRILHTNFLFEKIHYVHHSVGKPVPSVSFSNHTLEVVFTTPPILILLLVAGMSFHEFIVILTLSFIATASDHSNVHPFAFHTLHHCENKKTNYQQPFFTFWDHVCKTYNPKSEKKIPFWPI